MGLLSQESIDFQSTVFKMQLAEIFGRMKSVSKAKLVDCDEIGELSVLIKQRTGLRISFNIGQLDPSVEIPAVNKNNVLINSFIRNFVSSADGLRMINDADGMVRGSVNIMTGVVTGVFTEVTSTINLPVKMFTNTEFIPDEIAAVTLHEIGHLFTYYEFMAHSVTGNQVLSGMAKKLDGTNDIAVRESVLMGVKKALKLKSLDVKALAKNTNNKVVEVVVVSNMAKEVKSELGNNIYDMSTWEYLADEYATRHGAGKDLATALEKYYRGSWNISFRSLPAYLAMEALKVTLVFSFLPLLTIYLVAMDSTGDGTYDVPGARFKRIRNQIVENLKKRDLPKDDHERLTDDLNAIDSILANVNDRRQFVGILYDFLSPSGRTNRREELLQKELEHLGNNELYVRAAEMKNFVV